MPTPTKGPRLGGGPAHERLMMANLATALFEHGRITTTEAKAKRLRVKRVLKAVCPRVLAPSPSPRCVALVCARPCLRTTCCCPAATMS